MANSVCESRNNLMLQFWSILIPVLFFHVFYNCHCRINDQQLYGESFWESSSEQLYRNKRQVDEAIEEEEQQFENKVKNDADVISADVKYVAEYNSTSTDYEFVVELTNEYYCERFGPLHVLCCLKDNRTGMQYYDRGVNETEVDFIVKFLVRLRKRLLLGKEDRNKPEETTWLPKALRIRVVTWNQELQVFAQRISNQCQSRLNSSIIMATDRISSLTTIIVMSIDDNNKPRWTHALRRWYSVGIDNVPQDVIYRKGQKMDTYSAMVWGNSFIVGCGFSACRGNKRGERVKVYTCVFGPAGNIDGQKIYDAAEPPLTTTTLAPQTDLLPIEDEPQEKQKRNFGDKKPENSTEGRTIEDTEPVTTTKKPMRKNPFKKVIFKQEWDLG